MRVDNVSTALFDFVFFVKIILSYMGTYLLRDNKKSRPVCIWWEPLKFSQKRRFQTL